MRNTILYLFCLLLGFMSFGQVCSTLTYPTNGSIDIPVDATLTWEPVEGVLGYLVGIGTSIQDSRRARNTTPAGNVAFFKPSFSLPENTQIYVTITLFTSGPPVICNTESFRTTDVVTPPICTILTRPMNNEQNVGVDTSINWELSPLATRYKISVGTEPGNYDLFTRNISGSNTYNPFSDLPYNTRVYVNITPSNENGEAIDCIEESFVTESLPVPKCTKLKSPINDEKEVPLTTAIEWEEIEFAESYRVTIGSSPSGNDILDNVTFDTNTIQNISLDPNTKIYIKIIPFNSSGDAMDCDMESFTTAFDCTPIYDGVNNQMVSLKPDIEKIESIYICEENIPKLVSPSTIADGYRWFLLNSDGSRTLLSEEPQLNLTTGGEYLFEAYNTIELSGDFFECADSQTFDVFFSNMPIIKDVKITGQPDNLTIEILTDQIDPYEYSIDAEDGPYQSSNIFANQQVVNPKKIVYVRNKKGCGTAYRTLSFDLDLEGFPKFFTPNGDGVNDFWRYIPPRNSDVDTEILSITIYNRLGNLLGEIDPKSLGWNGSFNGKILPASDYWYIANFSDQSITRGHFTLKR